MRITVKNLGDYIKLEPDSIYDTDDDSGDVCMTFMWDEDNEKLCDLAEKDFRLRDLKKRNLMWVEEVKKYANWKKGEYLYIFTKSNCDSCYRVWFNKKKIGCHYDVIVEPSGYVAMQFFNQYTNDTDEDIKFSMFLRPDSIYNDAITKTLNKK
jgi:hypothetical protein